MKSIDSETIRERNECPASHVLDTPLEPRRLRLGLRFVVLHLVPLRPEREQHAHGADDHAQQSVPAMNS